MNNEANLVWLMTSFPLEIKALPDDLKCAKCKSVLKNACQVQCGCRFCRTCIDDVISRGNQFCPGGLQECGATNLSTALPDYRANKSVWKLIAKCPQAGCSHEYSLADLEDHLRLCLRKTMDYPFSPFYSINSTLDGHLLQESRGHSENLIGTVAKISRDMEILKQELLLKDEHMENEMKLIKDEIKLVKEKNESIKDENKSIKDENKSIKDEVKSIIIENKSIKEKNELIKEENESIKYENKLIKDENKSIKNLIKAMKDEMKSIKIENESIKRENEVLCDRVRQLAEKLEREIAMTIEVTAAVESNRDEMKPVRGDIRSIRDQVESIQIAVGLGQLDYFLIEEDVAMTGWGFPVNLNKTSGRFGLAHAFELASVNFVSEGELWMFLRIWAGLINSLLEWPLRVAVTVTVVNVDMHGTCSRQTQQCEIERPADNQCSLSNYFVFPHAAMRKVGLVLERGVHVSCRIVPV